MARARILVVEDEEDILELVRFNLAKEGFPLPAGAPFLFPSLKPFFPERIFQSASLPWKEICRPFPTSSTTPIIGSEGSRDRR